MDTIPFNVMMFAADICLVLVFGFWPHERSAPWSVAGLSLVGFLGLVAVVLFAWLFKANAGQCLAEGVLWHGGVFLTVASGILFYRSRKFLACIPLFSGASLLLLGFDALVYEPYALELEHYTIRSPKIRAPMRIVFLADIQTDHIGRYEEDVFRAVMQQQPDLILLGGDYLQLWEGVPPSAMTRLEERFRELFQRVPLTAPCGVYAVGGNLDPLYDEETIRSLFTGSEVHIFRYSKTIENLGEPGDPGGRMRGPVDLTLLSMEHSFGGYTGDFPRTGNFHIMLGHAPTFAMVESRRLKEAPDLLLAGHTHGGQIVLPGYGVLYYPRRNREMQLPHDWLSGFHPIGTEADDKWLLVSRGSGMERGWAPRIRLFCRPEISVIDLLPPTVRHRVPDN